MPRGRFVNRPYENAKSLINQGLLACLFDINCDRDMSLKQPAVVSNHGVVTCAEHIVCIFPENIIIKDE